MEEPVRAAAVLTPDACIRWEDSQVTMTERKTARRRRLGALVGLAASVISGCRARPQERAAVSANPEPAGSVVVRLSYGSEKKGFLTDAMERFHASRPKTRGGQPIRIEGVAEGSAESMESILAGRSDVAVWSPASSLLVDVLNARWAEAHGGLGAAKPIARDAQALVLSPVVIAMWQPMARALGWPGRPLGWKDIAEFAASERGWAARGNPQWGDFKFGHTHPRFSNSGAIALVAATYAGAGKSRDLTMADVAAAAPFVKRVEASVVHYGRSTGFFAEKMFSRGPGYLSAAVLYENLVAESALDPAYASKPFPVVAIYPREGTFWADHPYVVLDLPSVTAEQREAAEAFRAFLLSQPIQKIALDRHGFRPVDATLPLGPPLDAAHGIDPTQPENVLPNPPVAVTRRILDSFEQVKRPVSVTFVLDTSGSMRGDALARAKAGAAVFLDNLPAGDRVRVLLFSSDLRWASQNFEPVDDSRAQLKQTLDGAFASGNTSLYDAITEACRPAPSDAKGAVRAVVVLTDGEDTSSKTRLEDLLSRFRTERDEGDDGAGDSGAPRIYTIAYGPEAKPEILKQIAEAGGGAFFSGTPKDIARVYAELASFF